MNDANKSFIKSEGRRGVIVDNESTAQVGLQNSYNLLRQLFADLRKSSGTIVIAASSGEGYALESPQWKNGVFTYAIISALSSKAADNDKDGRITVSELRDFVIGKVSYLTDNRQQPTVRKDNIINNFSVW